MNSSANLSSNPPVNPLPSHGLLASGLHARDWVADRALMDGPSSGGWMADRSAERSAERWANPRAARRIRHSLLHAIGRTAQGLAERLAEPAIDAAGIRSRAASAPQRPRRGHAAPRWALHLLRVLVLLTAWLCAPSAQALCLPATGCTCTVSTNPLAFGSFNPLSGGAISTTTTMRVTCGGSVGLLIPYKLDFSTGGGTYATRKMSSGATNKLSYNIYTDNTYMTVWGDGTNSTQSVNGSVTLDVLGSAPPVTHTVYGRIPAGQTSTVPGTYTDTITVTVTYY